MRHGRRREVYVALLTLYPAPSDNVHVAIHGRSGKRIDSCKQLFGSLPSSSSSSSTALVLSGPETRLADAEMEETFGFELLDLYSNSSASSPLFPPPVFDSYSLKARFEAAYVLLSHPFQQCVVLTMFLLAEGSSRPCRSRIRCVFPPFSPYPFPPPY